MSRRRFSHTVSLQERLANFAAEAREKALRLPPSPERDSELEKARQADMAQHLNEWASSPGPKPPT